MPEGGPGEHISIHDMLGKKTWRNNMTGDKQQSTCRCGGSYDVIDSYRSSSTISCRECGHASLVITQPNVAMTIHLVDFHVKRGPKPDQRPIDDLKMAKDLWLQLTFDTWPSPAACVDFGIQTAEHYLALRHVVLEGISAYELDRVMGDGRAITSLVRGILKQLCPGIIFRTPYDPLVHDELQIGRLVRGLSGTGD